MYSHFLEGKRTYISNLSAIEHLATDFLSSQTASVPNTYPHEKEIKAEQNVLFKLLKTR